MRLTSAGGLLLLAVINAIVLLGLAGAEAARRMVRQRQQAPATTRTITLPAQRVVDVTEGSTPQVAGNR